MPISMKNLFVAVLIVGFPFLGTYSNDRVDSLLKVLDYTLSRRAIYEMKKESDISELKQKEINFGTS